MRERIRTAVCLPRHAKKPPRMGRTLAAVPPTFGVQRDAASLRLASEIGWRGRSVTSDQTDPLLSSAIPHPRKATGHACESSSTDRLREPFRAAHLPGFHHPRLSAKPPDAYLFPSQPFVLSQERPLTKERRLLTCRGSLTLRPEIPHHTHANRRHHEDDAEEAESTESGGGRQKPSAKPSPSHQANLPVDKTSCSPSITFRATLAALAASTADRTGRYTMSS